MKSICLLLFSIALISSLRAESIEDKVKNIIKQLKDAIPEPIEVANATIVIPENDIISGNLNISKLVVNGLKAMELSVNFLFGSIPTGFSFSLKNLQFNTGYQMKIPIFKSSILTMFGDGNLSLSLRNLNIKGSFKVSKLPNIFSNVTTSIDKAKFHITGLLDDTILSEQLSDDVSYIVPSIVNDKEFGKLLESTMNSIVTMIINRNKTEQNNFIEHEFISGSLEERENHFVLPEALGNFIEDIIQLFEN